MASTRTLLLMRHARAQDFAPGLSDEERPLTEAGVEQAAAVGEFLRGLDLSIDHVLCSAATRTQQTCAALELGVPVEYSWAVYNAGSERILEAITETFTDDVRVGLVIGHAPGIPALMHTLADDSSDTDALKTVGNQFPTGTLVQLAFEGSWHELDGAQLQRARLGR
ncbi:SixA phosphatase family protein [Enemella sp. A6]|uniref:SixA phosphatase family protein n=1 Tax=Enemella sp. A6 TaxID=3440152 RepID=UPI003EC0BC4C